jgi:hypothetical protein
MTKARSNDVIHLVNETATPLGIDLLSGAESETVGVAFDEERIMTSPCEFLQTQ